MQQYIQPLINRKDSLERATITFENLMGMHEIEHALEYFKENSKYNIEYTIIQTTRTKIVLTEKEPNQEIRLKRALEGRISKEGTIPEKFICKKSNQKNNTLIKSLNFFPIPECSLEQHRKEQIEIWDNTRKYFTEHFKKNYPKI